MYKRQTLIGDPEGEQDPISAGKACGFGLGVKVMLSTISTNGGMTVFVSFVADSPVLGSEIVETTFGVAPFGPVPGKVMLTTLAPVESLQFAIAPFTQSHTSGAGKKSPDGLESIPTFPVPSGLQLPARGKTNPALIVAGRAKETSNGPDAVAARSAVKWALLPQPTKNKEATINIKYFILHLLF